MTLDSVFRIASMTKAVTSVAAMQLVEQGRVKLEEPLRAWARRSPHAGARGVRRLRAPGSPGVRPITLRQLLTHTAGFCYEQWDANMVRYVKASGMPSTASGKVAALRDAARVRPGRQVGVQHQHRLGGTARRVAQRPDARRLLPRQDLRAARHEGQRLHHLGRAARAPGPPASATGRRGARAPAPGDGVQRRSSGRAGARCTRRGGTTSPSSRRCCTAEATTASGS